MTTGSQVLPWLGNQQILGSIIISLLLVGFIWRVDIFLSQYTDASEHTIENIRAFRRVATASMFVITLIWIVEQPNPPWLAEAYQSVGGPQLVSGVIEFLPEFVITKWGPLLVTVLGFWWVWVLRAEGDEAIERFVEEKYDESLAPIIENIWDVTIAAVFILIFLDQWGIGITALLAPAGIIGIIIGFSARKSVANFFGSISLYADETYNRGDFIELESEVAGTVRDISVRSTVLQTLDGDLVTIPNSELNEGKIINKSTPVPDRRIQSQIGVSYDADPERVRDILYEAALPISGRNEPEVHLRSFGDSALKFEVFVWIAKEENRLQTENDLNMAIHRALETAGIEIPFPQQEVTIEHDEPNDDA